MSISGARAQFGRVMSVVAFALIGLFLAGCEVPSSEDSFGPTLARGEVAMIGLLVPRSAQGPVSTIARDMENAARMALADLGSSRVTLQIYDTGGTPEGAAAAARRAVDEGAKILVGPLFFGSAVAASTEAAEDQINVLTFSNNPNVAGGNVYLLGQTFDDRANRLARFAVGRGQTDIMIVHANDVAGQAGRDAIGRAVQASGGRVVDIQGYPLSQQGIIERAAQIASAAGSAAPDALFLTADASSDLPLLLEVLPSEGLGPDDAQFYGLTQWDAFSEVLGIPGANGGIFAAADAGRIANFRARFSEQYGNTPHVLAPLAYDGVAAVGALVATGRRDALTSNALTNPRGFQGVGGVFRLLPNGMNERAFAVYQIQDGRVVTVDPAPTGFGSRLF